jgi:hypothetical protein
MDCPPGKVLNPETNRCVHVTGTIGKALARRRPLVPPESRVIEDMKFFYRASTRKLPKDHAKRGWLSDGRQFLFVIEKPWGAYVCVYTIGDRTGRVLVVVGTRDGPERTERTIVKFMAGIARFVGATDDEKSLFKVTAHESFVTRAKATDRATLWTTGLYKEVCNAMRGATGKTHRASVIINALKAYTKHAALVVPSMPQGLTARPEVLWRGVHAQTPPTVGSTVVSNGGCFTAFTYNEAIARHFGGDFMYRLQVDRIARGTPWIWMKFFASGVNTVKSTANESEVLLPPGYFKVLRRSTTESHRTPGKKVPVFDIAFVPAPGYVRKGALPSLRNGQVVTRTVRGNRLALDHPNLANNVRARRAATGRR